MKQAIIYTRVSSKEQIDGSSLEAQQNICVDYAMKNGYEVQKIFVELGESAKTTDRTQLKLLLDYAAKNYKNIDALIIYKLDRLTRSTLNHAQLKMLFNQLDIKITSATENLEDTPVGRLIENQLAGFAQFDNELRMEHCKGGMINAVKAGRYVWKAPVGYINIAGKGTSNIVPDNEKTVKLIHKVWDLLDIGFTLEEVRRSVTEEGLRGKTGKPISKSYFHTMVRNKTYMGMIEVFGLTIVGSFTPLVESDLFLRVLDKIEGRHKKMPVYKKDHEDFPLRGTVKCNHCGKYMTASWSRGNGGKFAYYRCVNCHKMNYKRLRLEENFVCYLTEHNYKPGLKDLITKIIELNFEDRNKLSQKRVGEVKKEIINLNAKISQLVEKNFAGVINDSRAKEMIAENEDKIATLELELKSYEITTEDIQKVVKHSLGLLENLGELWQKSDLEIKKRFQKFFFPDGLLYDGKEFRTTNLPLCIGVTKYFNSKKSCLVDLRRFELLTSSLPAMRSSQLS